MGALLFHIEKPPMLLDELDSGLSNSSFSFSSGQPSIGAPLIFIIPCISVNGKFIGKKEAAFTFSFYKMGRFYRGLHYAINIFSYCWRNSPVFC